MKRGCVYFLTASGWLFGLLYVSVFLSWSIPPPQPRLELRISCPNSFVAIALKWFGIDMDRHVAVCERTENSRLPEDVLCALPHSYRANNSHACMVFYADLPTLSAFETEREIESQALKLRKGDVALFKTRHSLDGKNGHPDEILMRRDGHTFYAALGRAPTGLIFPPERRCVIAKEVLPRSSPPVWIMMFREEAGSVFESRARQYAEKHGYGFLRPGSTCTVPGLPRSWLKHALLRHAVLQTTPGRSADDGWILWLDPVALITNMEMRIESFIATDAARQSLLLLSSDAMPPFLGNVGVLLARKHVELARLIDTIWNVGVARGWDKELAFYWDQNAINYLLERAMSKGEFDYWLHRIRVLPHRSLSSFMRSGAKKDLIAGHWRQGDFIALITGPPAEDALLQAKLLLESEQLGHTRISPFWLKRTESYQFPEVLWVPFSFSLPLDTFFSMNRPNYLSFPKRTPGTMKSTPINPTCLWSNADETSLFCVVRTINYHLNLETGKYEWPARGMTVNLFFSLDSRQVLEEEGQTIVVEDPEEMLVTLHVQGKLRRVLTEGFEDVKLIRYKNQVYGVCTNLQMHPRGNCEIVMLSLSHHQVDEATPMRGFKPDNCHKNWMAFELNNALHFVETVDPLTVVTPSLPEGLITPLYIAKEKRYAGLRLRGTSAGISFHEGHLFVVHETVTRGKEYASRFMYLAGGPNFPLRKLSKPFFIVRKTVEFLIGIMLPKSGDRLLLCFGFEDSVPAFRVLHIGSPRSFLEHPYFWME